MSNGTGGATPNMASLCVEIGALTEALKQAYQLLKWDRDSAYKAAYNHAEGCITDPKDREFVDQYDRVLERIRRAFALSKRNWPEESFPTESEPAAPQVFTGKHNVFVAVPNSLNLDTQILVIRFATVMAEKLAAAEHKGRGGWGKTGWKDECTEQLYLHLQKGDPIDVANYCAFMWHHGWSTSAPAVFSQDVGENDKVLLLTSKTLSKEQCEQIKEHFEDALQSGAQCIIAQGFDQAVIVRRPQISVSKIEQPAQEASA
jgi:hypothetical protein